MVACGVVIDIEYCMFWQGFDVVLKNEWRYEILDRCGYRSSFDVNGLLK